MGSPRIYSIFPNINFSLVWNNIHSVVLGNNVKDFCFEIVHKILYTGQFLQRMNFPRCDSRCQFCKSDVESLEHLFFACKFVKPLWLRLQDLCSLILSTTVNITLRNVIFCLFNAHLVFISTGFTFMSFVN